MAARINKYIRNTLEEAGIKKYAIISKPMGENVEMSVMRCEANLI